MAADINPKELRNQLIRYERRVQDIAQQRLKAAHRDDFPSQWNSSVALSNACIPITKAIEAIKTIEELLYGK